MQKNIAFSSEQLLMNLVGDKNLTRKVIEKFTENELFSYSLGGMRPFSEMIKELGIITRSILELFFTGSTDYSTEETQKITSKEALLDYWDGVTQELQSRWSEIAPEDFQKIVPLFGKPFDLLSLFLYSIENECHHRGQGYVYLRTLNIEPPYFWDREGFK